MFGSHRELLVDVVADEPVRERDTRAERGRRMHLLCEVLYCGPRAEILLREAIDAGRALFGLRHREADQQLFTLRELARLERGLEIGGTSRPKSG